MSAGFGPGGSFRAAAAENAAAPRTASVGEKAAATGEKEETVVGLFRAEEKKPPTAGGGTGKALRFVGTLTTDDGVSCRVVENEHVAEAAHEYDGLRITLHGRVTVRKNAEGTEERLLETLRAPAVVVPLWWSLPFALLLAAIAVMPFINQHWWEHHYPKVAFALGGLVAAVYLLGMKNYGAHRMLHTGVEYFQFMALVGSLFVVTGGLLVNIRGPGTPGLNTALLAVGAVIANIFGTTGAAVLLIRPFMRLNKHRLRPFHIVMFIFLVCNIGGALTPIGDPPLFLGYLKGVPFTWTLAHCWPAWATAVGLLLAIFYFVDFRLHRTYLRQVDSGEKTPLPPPPPGTPRLRLDGVSCFFWLGLILFGVFFDKLLEDYVTTAYKGIPLGALVMVIAATVAYRTAKRENLAANEFNFEPVKEVGYLFIGIFATMVPALDYLEANAAALGISSPGAFYFGTGALSSFLDNAPTYLNFLAAAHGLTGVPLDGQSMAQFLNTSVSGVGGMVRGADLLLGISLGAVFFGANTYIGNGPNFMIKAIAEAGGAKMPTFFGYVVKYSIPLLLPVLLAVWLLFL